MFAGRQRRHLFKLPCHTYPVFHLTSGTLPLSSVSVLLFLKVALAPGDWEVLAVVVPVPPFTCLLRDLAPATNYSLRVRCANALGPSPYADWVPFQTKGLGKECSQRGETGEGGKASFSQHLLSTYCMLLHTTLYLVLVGGTDR